MAQQEATLLLRIKKAGAEVLDEVSDKLQNLTGVAIAVGAAIVGFGYKALTSFRESELASNQLSQAMVQQGVYTTELKSKYDAMAESLQKVTGFADEQITSAQALLQAGVGQREVTEGLVRATLDLAAAKGMDLSSAADLVSKAVSSETNTLARYGIEVENSADKTQKMANVVEALNSKFGGQAEAAAAGLGVIESIKNQLGEFLEDVGARIAPGVIAVGKAFLSMFENMNSGGHLIDSIGFGFHTLSSIVVVAIGLFEKIGMTAGTVIGGIADAMMNMVNGNFKAAWESAKSIVTVAMDDWQAKSQETMNRLQQMDEAYLATKEGNLMREEELIRASNERKDAIREEHDMKEAEKQLEKDIAAQDRMILEQEMLGMSEQQKLATKMRSLDEQIKAEENFELRKNLVAQRGALAQQQVGALKLAQEQEMNKKRVQDQEATLNTIATLQQSNNSTLAAIGKAAAITQIAIETPVAIAKALSAFPPPFNFAAAGLVGAAMAAQAARIAGVQLAEGGIVSASPGGTLATIGEGGRDEAVIPLPDDFDPDQGLGGGTKITINVSGGLLGDESQARQFAVALDRELLKLRQRNESVAFDGDVF